MTTFLSPFIEGLPHFFRFYNHTHYSGLETHITNSYTNAMLQIMFYTLPIRRLAKSHITTDCQREHCLFCELGFVVRMLEDARGTNCQSSNFCKVVGVLAQSVWSVIWVSSCRTNCSPQTTTSLNLWIMAENPRITTMDT